ncbi:MAG: IS607 family transposase, partial [Chloroflexi bacterium]
MPDSALALDGKRREFPRLMEQAELVQIRRIVIAQPGRFET